MTSLLTSFLSIFCWATQQACWTAWCKSVIKISSKLAYSTCCSVLNPSSEIFWCTLNYLFLPWLVCVLVKDIGSEYLRPTHSRGWLLRSYPCQGAAFPNYIPDYSACQTHTWKVQRCSTFIAGQSTFVLYLIYITFDLLKPDKFKIRVKVSCLEERLPIRSWSWK